MAMRTSMIEFHREAALEARLASEWSAERSPAVPMRFKLELQRAEGFNERKIV